MAVLHPSPPFLRRLLLLLILTSLMLQSSPVHSHNCSSERFITKKPYSHCTDLPTLNSTLHWTFNPQNSHLSIAFAAPPATPNGWIAWAINPNNTGMVGCQAFIAFKNSNGSMTVKTYNITSESSIVEGKISFEVVESKAEYSGGVMRIFATVKLADTTRELNQVWQVGGSVKNGIPGKHEFLAANMKAMSKLQLVAWKGDQSNGTTSAGATGASGPAVAPITSSSSNDARYIAIVVVLICLTIDLFKSTLGFF